jgi:hypothetical protein
VNSVPATSGHSELIFSTTRKEPDGLITLVDPSQVQLPRNVNGDAMSFDILDELLERMDKFNVVGEVAFVMHTRQLRALKARGRGLGGARIEDRMFGSARVPMYEGNYPLLATKYIPNVVQGTSQTSHSVFAVNMNSDKGFFGLTAGGPEGLGMQTASASGDPVMGFKIRDLGMAKEFNGDEEMIVWNGAFGNRSVQGIAEYKGVYDA